jgi:hypothetical protein
MERREAQHPYVTGVRAPRGRTRNPVLENWRAGRPDRKGMPMRGLANPWRLPALHSPFWGEEKRDSGLPGAFNNTGDDARLKRA